MPQKQNHRRLGAGKPDLFRLRRPAAYLGNGRNLMGMFLGIGVGIVSVIVVVLLLLALDLGGVGRDGGWKGGGVQG